MKCHSDLTKFRTVFFATLFLLASCSANLFDEIADKDTNEALYFEAKQELNNRNYAAAIDLFNQIDAIFLQDRERIPVHASAYSGRCGLEFLTLLNNLQNAPGGSTVFTTLMSAFPGAAASNVQDCIDAEGIIEVIGDASARNGDENLLLAFNSLAKIGTILSSLADADDNGAADAGFDQCDNTDFPDTSVRELGASLAVALLSLTAIGQSYVDDTLTDVTTLCGLDPQLNAFCSSTDPAAFTPLQVQTLRYLIGSSDQGINSCSGDDFNNCILNNPACP